MGLTTTVRDIIAELNRQAAEHQREISRIQQSHGRHVFHNAPDGWRVVLEPSSDADSPHFSPAVNALMNEVHMNEASLSCIRAKIDALATFLVPAFRLPPEVLVLIFKAGARMPQDGPVTESFVSRPFPLVIASVSRQWRDIAISTPELWTNITIQHPRHYNWIPVCLQRSCGLPVDVTMDCRSTNLLTAPIVDGMMSRLMPHVHRWRRFALMTCDPATAYVIGQRLSDASAPQLRHLQLSLSGSSGNQEVMLPAILQGGAEALSSVRFDSLATPWGSAPLMDLTTIDLRWLWLRTRLQYEQFRDMLAASPRIRALILRGTYIHLHAGRTYPPLSIPTLRYLELSGDTVCRMSSLLSTPALEELTLANLDETEFREFVESLPLPTAAGEGGRYPALRSLSLLNASMCTPTRAFMLALPTITHLTVINSATAKFLELFRKDSEHAAAGAAEGRPSWPRLRKLTLVDDVDYHLLYGVVQERAALGLPLTRLVLNAPFIHDEALVESLEEYVEVDIVKDVDLDH
ncbi:hypothetical protein BN946_scf184844.g38 [Trametes cinnabarina]|uniref:F-box domain-containing protein n=1 Tax=Pycnoporus cinnabarinus TaxID=5643 RepID=A0A060SFK4_PYCCI|nr:hypothetical protein BN946_scf184844.g38 [Trametes cinnabarina]